MFCFVFGEMIGFLERDRESVELNRRRRFKWTLSLTEVVVGPIQRVTCHSSLYLFVCRRFSSTSMPFISLSQDSWHTKVVVWSTNNVCIFVLFCVNCVCVLYNLFHSGVDTYVSISKKYIS